jgi:hypothetical protein
MRSGPLETEASNILLMNSGLLVAEASTITDGSGPLLLKPVILLMVSGPLVAKASNITDEKWPT